MNKRRIFLQRQGYDDVLCAKSQQLNVDGTGAAMRFILRGEDNNERARALRVSSRLSFDESRCFAHARVTFT